MVGKHRVEGQGGPRNCLASDAELIDRSLSGDGNAFVEVICRHEVALGAYVARRTGRDKAEDLLGDVGGGGLRVPANP
jgi:hypothetical protein